MEPDRTILEAVFRRLAVAAGAAIMEVRGSGDLGTEAKEDQSPVTRADLAADRIISAGLAAAFPDVPAVTEEQATSHETAGHRAFFLVDPLDGTKEFVRRGTDFTVNIALIEANQPTFGVVYAPARGRLWITAAGGGATVEETAADGAQVAGSRRPISVSTPDNSALVVVASKSHRTPETDTYLEHFRVADFASAGSSLKFCLVAEGTADFYPRLGRTMEWDTAAGHAVLAAAGGEVLRFEDHAPFAYGKPGYENGFFIARAPGVELVAP